MGKTYHRSGDSSSLFANFDSNAGKRNMAAVLMFFIVCLCSSSTIKCTAIVCILMAVAAVIVCSPRLKSRISLPLIGLALVVLMDGISTFYAASGKFALNEFLKIMVSFCLVLILLSVTKGEGSTPARTIAFILERSVAIAGLVSIDLLSTHFISTPVLSFLGLFSADYSSLDIVETGIRMTSIFNTPNVFAGISGIGVFLSFGLVLSSETEHERKSHIVCLFINALAFVLVFSMGASAFILVAFLVYLILELKSRRAALFVLMAETLIVTIIAAALISMSSFDTWKGFQPIPLLCIMIGASFLCLLDKYVGRRIADQLLNHGKVLLVVILAAASVLVGYALAAFNVTGAITLQEGETLRRSAYLDAGEYTLYARADDPIAVTIESQNKQDTMMHTSTVLYTGQLSHAAFTVPEDSLVVYFNFKAGKNTILETVTYTGEDTSGSIPLNYILLPSYIANRLQGLLVNQNAIQRLVFFQDGVKLFRHNPAFGLGLGSFENGVMSVQSFYYETKYAHNHYIQTLTETGIVGLFLFAGLLVVSAAAVLLDRRKSGGGHTMTPALGAALVFMAGHAAVEVDFSYYAFLPIAFPVFALINLCCGQAIPISRLTDTGKNRFCLGCCGMIAVFFVLLCGNIAAANVVKNNPTFSSLDQAVSLDFYEKNDYKLSYVLSSSNAANYPSIQAQAAEYAEQLSGVNSNTIPLHLADYYFSCGEVEAGMKMLEKYVDYVSSDSDAWNRAFETLSTYFQDNDSYRNGVARIYQMMETWTAENIGTITLNDNSLTFLSEIGLY